MKIKVRKYKNLKAEEHLKTGKRRMVQAVKANDGGLTPVEIIIGVTLLAILSGAVVFQAFRFIARADDSAARRSLQAAVTAADALRSESSTGEGRNFSGEKIGADQAAVNKNAISNLSADLSGATFSAYGDGSFAYKSSGTPDGEVLKSSNGDAQELWVYVNKDPLGLAAALNAPVVNLNHGADQGVIGLAKDAAIRPGNLIRIGVKSVSGSSFCGVIVTNGVVKPGSVQSPAQPHSTTSLGTGAPTVQRIQGTGWQAVDATATATDLSASAKGGSAGGADCGQGALQTSDAFAEMPGILGTDASLNNPVASGYGTK